MSRIEIKRATEEDWEQVRVTRLAALKDAPYAFGSTYERDLAFDEETWRSRLRDLDNVTFLAVRGEEILGMDGVYVDGGIHNLVAMWVAPNARRQGVGEALTQA